MVNSILETLLLEGHIRPLDFAFAKFIASQEEGQSPELVHTLSVLAAFVSMRVSEQDSCVDMAALDGRSKTLLFEVAGLPVLTNILSFLTKANTVTCIDSLPEQNTRPMVLEGTRLYLQRYWHYEQGLAKLINARAASRLVLDETAVKSLLAQVFPKKPPEDLEPSTSNSEELDWQKIAVCAALDKRFTLITGGPGTGKTSTVTKLMAVLSGLGSNSKERCLIKLVAPTGKAAARLSESIRKAVQGLPEVMQQQIPLSCSTIHRLLGTKPYTPYFKHDQDNPLDLDVLVVDEASMIDLPLMYKLINALPAKSQLIMLGDQEQLASVETGSVLSDICAAAWPNGRSKDALIPPYSAEFNERIKQLLDYQLPIKRESTGQQLTSNSGPAIADNLVILQRSYRFSASSEIGQLASAIRIGQASTAFDLLNAQDAKQVYWHRDALGTQLAASLMPVYREYFAALKQVDVLKAFGILQSQQVLCAQRTGEWGVGNINHLIQEELAKQGLVDQSQAFYLGRPIILNQNDHQLNLFNGDIGIVAPDPHNKLNKVWFIGADGKLRGVFPSRLPSHETVYAMTIHKSQGSEFDHVHLCLPNYSQGQGRMTLSREILYTGLTRAKFKFSLYANEAELSACLAKQSKRSSGLHLRLSTL